MEMQGLSSEVVVLERFVYSIMEAAMVEAAIFAAKSIACLLFTMGYSLNGASLFPREPVTFEWVSLAEHPMVKQPDAKNKDGSETEDNDEDDEDGGDDQDEDAGEDEDELSGEDGNDEDEGGPEDEPAANGDGGSEEEDDEEDDDDEDDDEDEDGEEEDEEENEDEDQDIPQPPAKRRK